VFSGWFVCGVCFCGAVGVVEVVCGDSFGFIDVVLHWVGFGGSCGLYGLCCSFMWLRVVWSVVCSREGCGWLHYGGWFFVWLWVVLFWLGCGCVVLWGCCLRGCCLRGCWTWLLFAGLLVVRLVILDCLVLVE